MKEVVEVRFSLQFASRAASLTASLPSWSRSKPHRHFHRYLTVDDDLPTLYPVTPRLWTFHAPPNRVPTKCTWKAGRRSYKTQIHPCPILRSLRTRFRTSSISTASAATAQNYAPLLGTNSERKSLMSPPSKRSSRVLGRRGRGPRPRFTRDKWQRVMDRQRVQAKDPVDLGSRFKIFLV